MGGRNRGDIQPAVEVGGWGGMGAMRVNRGCFGKTRLDSMGR